MGLFFTLFFAMCAYLSPDTVFGEYAQYHLQLVIFIAALVGSLFALNGSGVFRSLQAKAVFGLIIAVALSWIFIGLKGEVVDALLNFIPNVMIYYLVVITCKKKIHLQLLVAVLLGTALFNIYEGHKAIQYFEATRTAENPEPDSPRIVMQHGLTEDFPRMQALSFLGDPNDFGQFLIAMVPCMFFFWVPGKKFRNLILVYVPAVILLYGLYLTRSRGGMLAMLTALIVSARRKLGLLPSVLIAGVLFAGLTAAGWTGGRDVSAASGADRTSAWGAGLELLKAHPLFGVGFNRFAEYYPITAHNTIVVCAAEVGMFGFFFWMLFLLPTIRNAHVTSEGLNRKTRKQLKAERDAAPLMLPSGLGFSNAVVAEGLAQPYVSFSGGGVEAVNAINHGGAGVIAVQGAPIGYGDDEKLETPDEIHRMGNLMLISLAGFLAAGWFLSRAFTMTFFVLGGMVQALYEMAERQNLVPPPLQGPLIVKRSIQFCLGAIVMMWLFLRVDNMLPK